MAKPSLIGVDVVQSPDSVACALPDLASAGETQNYNRNRVSMVALTASRLLT